MPFALVVPDEYGYAAIVALGVIPFLAWMQGNVVGVYRKPAGISYPNAYATHEQAKKERAAYQFNCAQRAHGNLIENISQAIAMTLFAGLFYPRAAATTAVVWVISRIIFAYGYITSEKNGSKRLLGSSMWLAQGGLWGMCIAGALTLI